MAYESGELHIGGKLCEKENCFDCSNDINIGEIYLPHSCDEWIIGNLEEAKNLRDDLNKAIEILESEKYGPND